MPGPMEEETEDLHKRLKIQVRFLKDCSVLSSKNINFR